MPKSKPDERPIRILTCVAWPMHVDGYDNARVEPLLSARQIVGSGPLICAGFDLHDTVGIDGRTWFAGCWTRCHTGKPRGRSIRSTRTYPGTRGSFVSLDSPGAVFVMERQTARTLEDPLSSNVGGLP
jgi:hypothetical protein